VLLDSAGTVGAKSLPVPMARPPSMFESSPQSTSAPAGASSYIQPNFGHGLRIWWAFFWPTNLIAAILIIAVNFVVKLGYENSHIPASVAGPILKYDNLAVPYIIGLFVMDYILQKKFRHFRVALLTNQGGAGAQQPDSTLLRALRVWWTYSWRTLVYRVIATFVATIPIAVMIGLFDRTPSLQAVVRLLFFVALDGAAGLFVIYSNIIDEDFGDFRVCLLPAENETDSPVAPAPTPAQT
jgi:hypothetical protein